ncbi:MAG: hypothetical protein MUF14_06930 [Hyphomonadaceae bacterium]|jgi:hypothetical protein|nr:hypothetical protein [Hyphomonadaceae bacterium]
MKRNPWRSVFCLMVVTATLGSVGGCYGALGGELIRPGEATGTLRIINGSGTTVTSVLISECRASSYGLNRLPEGTVLRPGQAWNVTVSGGCYDVMVGYGTATGYAAATQRLSVAAGGMTSFTANGR